MSDNTGKVGTERVEVSTIWTQEKKESEWERQREESILLNHSERLWEHPCMCHCVPMCVFMLAQWVQQERKTSDPLRHTQITPLSRIGLIEHRVLEKLCEQSILKNPPDRGRLKKPTWPPVNDYSVKHSYKFSSSLCLQGRLGSHNSC